MYDQRQNIIRYTKTLILFLMIVAITGCATHYGTRALRKQAFLINNGMSKQDVLDIMGMPGNRQFHEKYEAWQYKSYGMLEDDLHIIWFVDGKVTEYNIESRKDLPLGFDYKRVDW